MAGLTKLVRQEISIKDIFSVNELYRIILTNNEFMDEPEKIKHRIRSVLSSLHHQGEIIRLNYQHYKKSESFKYPSLKLNDKGNF